MANYWKKLSLLGVENFDELEYNRNCILNNQVNVMMLATMLVELCIESVTISLSINTFNLSTVRIILIALTCTSNLVLAKYKLHLYSKLSTAIFIPFFFFIYPVLSHCFLPEIFLWYSFASITYTLIPFLIFNSNEKGYMFGTSIYIGIIAFFIDSFALWMGSPNFLEYRPNVIIFNKLAQAGCYVFVMFSIYYFRKINSEYENQLRKANADITDKSNLLASKAKELKAHNQLLQEHKEELQAKNEELSNYQLELNLQNEELKVTMDKLSQTHNQLVQAEKMSSLGVLTAGIAHEINNPINFISTGAAGLRTIVDEAFEVMISQDNIDQDGKAVQKLKELKDEADLVIENIQAGVKRTSDIVRGLSKFSRMESNKMELSDINDIIESTISLISGKIKDRIILKKELSEIPEIFCFPVSIGQILMNLISNAVQAIPIKGEITISSAYENRNVVLKVKDTGTGISDNLKGKIFEPFFTTKNLGNGTGIGLSITQGLVDKHKGSISFETKVGSGTTFTVNIPAVTEVSSN